MFKVFRYAILITLLVLNWSCSAPEEEAKEKVVIPKKITYLFVTQPSCPSCDKLEETMELKKPHELLTKYFEVKKIYLGEKLPEGLLPEPNGTPTVYFLGANNEVLVEPMIGEKTEEQILNFLNVALYEFKNTYHVDLVEKYKKSQENNKSYAQAH